MWFFKGRTFDTKEEAYAYKEKLEIFAAEERYKRQKQAEARAKHLQKVESDFRKEYGVLCEKYNVEIVVGLDGGFRLDVLDKEKLNENAG